MVMSKSLCGRVCSQRSATTPHPPSIQISTPNFSRVVYRSITSAEFMPLFVSRVIDSRSAGLLQDGSGGQTHQDQRDQAGNHPVQDQCVRQVVDNIVVER